MYILFHMNRRYQETAPLQLLPLFATPYGIAARTLDQPY